MRRTRAPLPALIVAVSGPDGAGKTTLCNDVRERLQMEEIPATVQWLRPGSSRFLRLLKNPLLTFGRCRPSAERPLIGESDRSPKAFLRRHRMLRSVWAGVVAIDFLLRAWAVALAARRRGGVHICDRFVIDGGVDLTADYGSDRWTRFVVAVGPRPDVHVLLRVDPAVAAARSETPVTASFSQAVGTLYERLAPDPDLVLDVTDGEQSSAAHRVYELVLRRDPRGR